MPSSCPAAHAASTAFTWSCAMSKHSPSLLASTLIRPTPSAHDRLTSPTARSRSRGNSRSARATRVVKPTSPVSIDRAGGGSVCPEIAASAAATTCTGVLPSDSLESPSRIFCAVGVKYGSSSLSTSFISREACSADAVMTSPPVGGVITLKFTPVSRAINFTRYCSRGVYIAMALPVLFARPVRPHRCTKLSVSCGSS